jgi:hypothetical protein
VRRAGRGLLALELAVLALIVAAHVWLLTRLLRTATFFDEGVYLVSLQELEHGQALGRDVFGSQMPGFYLLLQGIGALTPLSVVGVRAGFAAVTALGAIFAYLLGRRLAGPLGGLLAAGMIAVAPTLPQIGGRVFADPPAMVLAVAAFWLAAARRPAASGGALAAAALVKLSALTAAPALLGLLLLRAGVERRRDLLQAVAGSAVVIAAVSLVYLRDLGAVWDGAVSYHVEGRHVGGLEAMPKIIDFFTYSVPFVWFTVAGLVATAFTWRSMWPLWLWPAATVAFLLQFQPLRDNHFAVLPYSFALPAAVAIGLAGRRLQPRLLAVAVVAAALALGAGWWQQRNRVSIDQRPEDATLVRAAAELERLTAPTDLVVSDQPIVAFLAKRRQPGDFVDTASFRCDTGSLTVPGVLRAIEDDPRIAAVVAGRSFLARPRLLDGFARLFARRELLPGAVIFHRRR